MRRRCAGARSKYAEALYLRDPWEAIKDGVRESLEADEAIDLNGAVPPTEVMAEAGASIQRRGARHPEPSIAFIAASGFNA